MKGTNSTIAKGRLGEGLATAHFEEVGFNVLERNFRYKRAEIDLIVQKENLLVFVEVKYRKNEKFGFPEEFVSDNQKQLIISAADQYISDQNWEGNIRFDIVAINAKKEIEHFEDAFY